MDVPAETLSMPQSGFIASRQSHFGAPLSRGPCPGTSPTSLSRAHGTALLAPWAGAGVKQEAVVCGRPGSGL